MSPSTAVKASDASVSLVNPEQTLKASKALLAHIKKAVATPNASGKQNLLADEESTIAETPIWLTMTTKLHLNDTNRLAPAKIALPHPLNSDNESTICLITADPQRWYKNAVASEQFPEELRKRITRVVDLTHIKAKFKSFEAQRKLFGEHDIFLGDDRIINRLPKALGKTFFKSTVKRPIPIVLMQQREKVDGKRIAAPKGKKAKRDPTENINARPIPEIAAEIQKAIGSALVSLSPTTNTAIKCGYASWEAEKLAENVDKLVSELVERFVPQKWKNVRNFYIKGPETAALPIYQTDELWLDETKVIPDGQEKKPKAEKTEKANIGKKRKSLDAEPEVATIGDAAAEAPREDRPTKKAKKVKAVAAVPESNDDKLDKEIAERKSKLKKQKAAAKKAVDV
ncbi:ribosomal protein L1p/L10e family-domain-containing protein [Podospora appendiculata]|uniref:Ribosomal protein L1p/L10e family-domain-containing protein n=1 Tax=Podospora appendiculata TaxID=314037 RepID=A0AAE0X8J1_9PEZI|nr:ribosomal protein L1p/L10e family-domain-containing protein [Podospora appendiculata]